MMTPTRCAVLAVLLCVAGSAAAQTASPVTPILSVRLRHETWDWFDAGAAGEYSFLAAHARLGVAQQRPTLGWRIEFAAPVLRGLPQDAALAAPAGALGLGANYAAANSGRRDAAGLFIKQAFVRWGAASAATRATVGRFEFADGGEYIPPDTVLATLRQQRLSQRLLGSFGFTHGQRSFDGVTLSQRVPRGAISAAVLRPTTGVFDVDGAGSLPVDIVYAAWNVPVTIAAAPHDARLFVLHAADRRGTVPTDSRPIGARSAAPRDIEVTTVGGHWLGHRTVGPVRLDIFAWTAQQFGRWGGLTHRAHALAIEGGARLPAGWGRPGLRVGLAQGSGDADAQDQTHGSFYQVLPTPRAYAAFPFYNLQNSHEVFAQVEVSPRPNVTVKLSAHALRLTEAADLWYLGGGAYDRRSFGFAGRPAGGRSDLGRVIDASVDWQASRHVSVAAYAATATGGSAMVASYGQKSPGAFSFVELTLRR